MPEHDTWRQVGLRYRRIWQSTGVAMILLVVWLSLADIYLPQVPSSLGDKINHLFAYGVLMGWHGQFFIAMRQRVILAVGLILLGLSMEYLQGVTAYRHFDWVDACANAVGVLLGGLALYFGADRILRWFERAVLKVA